MGDERLTRRELVRRCLLEVAIGFALGSGLMVFAWVKANLFQGGPPFDWTTFILFACMILVAALLLALRDYRLGMAKIRQQESEEGRARSRFASLCLESYPTALADRSGEWGNRVGDRLVLKELLEEKNLNYHRVIARLEYAPGHAPDRDYELLRREILGWIRECIRGSWWRGVGIGLLVEDTGQAVPTPEEVTPIVDGSGARTHVIQWLVYCCHARKECLAIHMGEQGRSTPCFVRIVADLESRGYQVRLGVREAAGIYKWARKASDIFPWWAKLLVGP
jgi:hypothetical protein